MRITWLWFSNQTKHIESRCVENNYQMCQKGDRTELIAFTLLMVAWKFNLNCLNIEFIRSFGPIKVYTHTHKRKRQMNANPWLLHTAGDRHTHTHTHADISFVKKFCLSSKGVIRSGLVCVFSLHTKFPVKQTILFKVQCTYWISSLSRPNTTWSPTFTFSTEYKRVWSFSNTCHWASEPTFAVLLPVI